MDAAEEQQVLARLRPEGELREVDAVVDRGEIGEVGVAVRVRDAHVVSAAGEGAVDRQDPLAREAVDGGERGRANEARVGQRQEIVVVVDEVERRRVPEGVGEVQPLPHLRVHPGRLLVRRGHHGAEAGAGAGIGGGEERDVNPGRDQALGEQRHDALPRAVMPRRYPPRDRRQHADAQGAVERRVAGEDMHWPVALL